MQKINPGMVALSAGGVILGCSLLAACGLAIFFVLNLSSPAPVPTRTSVARQITPQQTATAGANATPTLLPLFTPVLTTRPGGVATAVVPGVPPPSGSAAQAVRDYYNLVSEKRLNESWQFLSEDFKQLFNCCAPNYNYTEYVNWWNSVERVEFGEVRTVSQSGGRAVVYAELSYRMRAGGVSQDNEPYIELVYDAGRGVWLFDDKGATESGRAS